jgi:hypothetical protein
MRFSIQHFEWNPNSWMSHPSHSTWFNHSNNTWWRVYNLEFYNTQFSPPGYYFIFLRIKYILSTLIQTPSTQVLYLDYNTKFHTISIFIILYILSIASIVTGYGLDSQGLIPRRVMRISTSPQSPEWFWGSPRPSYPMGTGASFLGGNGAGAWSWPPPPPSFMVKSGGAIPPFPMYLHSVVLIKHRDFTFTFYSILILEFSNRTGQQKILNRTVTSIFQIKICIYFHHK